jgi:HEAT repeat protein
MPRSRSFPTTAGLAFALIFVHAFVASAADKKGPPVEERAAQIRRDLHSSDVAIRVAAVKALPHNDAAKLLLPDLIAALGDADGEVREWAATVLGPQGVAALPAVPQLIKQLQSDPVAKARETAARALGRIMKAAPDERRAMPILVASAKNDADSVTRVVSLGALALVEPDAPRRIDAVRAYLTSDDPLTRMKAAHSLGVLLDKARAAGPAIAAALQQATEPHQRAYLARAVGQVGDRAQLPILEAEYAKETDPTTQGEMRGAIKRLGGDVKAARR